METGIICAGSVKSFQRQCFRHSSAAFRERIWNLIPQGPTKLAVLFQVPAQASDFVWVQEPRFWKGPVQDFKFV